MSGSFSWNSRYNEILIRPGVAVRLNNTSDKSQWELDVTDAMGTIYVIRAITKEGTNNIILEEQGIPSNEWWVDDDFLKEHFELALPVINND